MNEYVCFRGYFYVWNRSQFNIVWLNLKHNLKLMGPIIYCVLIINYKKILLTCFFIEFTTQNPEPPRCFFQGTTSPLFAIINFDPPALSTFTIFCSSVHRVFFHSCHSFFFFFRSNIALSNNFHKSIIYYFFLSNNLH